MQQIQSQEDLRELIDYMKAQGAPKEAMRNAVRDFMKSEMPGTMRGVGQMAKALPGAATIQQEKVQERTALERLKGKSPLVGSVQEKIMRAEPAVEQIQKSKDFLSKLKEGELEGAASAKLGLEGKEVVDSLAIGFEKLANLIGTAADVPTPAGALLGTKDVFKEKGVPTMGEQIKEAGVELMEPFKSEDPSVGAEIVGSFIAQIPTLVAGLGAGKAAKASSFLKTTAQKYPKMVEFFAVPALESVVTTTGFAASERGEAPSAKELGLWGIADLVLKGAGGLGEKVFKSAFGTDKGMQRRLLQQYGKTSQEIASELSLPAGTPDKILAAIKKNKQGIWNKIGQVAKETAPVQREAFEEVSDNIIRKLTKDLPDSQFKKTLSEAITEEVMKFAPTKQATGKQLVGIIKRINQDLLGEGTRAVMTPKQASSLANSIKKEVKVLLPKKAQPFYEQYAKHKVIEKVLNEDKIKRLLGRSMFISGPAAITGAISNQDDPLMGIMKGLIAGAMITGASASTTGKTIVGKGLQKIGESQARSLAKVIANQLANIAEKYSQE